jgi:hypothetical protein
LTGPDQLSTETGFPAVNVADLDTAVQVNISLTPSTTSGSNSPWIPVPTTYAQHNLLQNLRAPGSESAWASTEASRMAVEGQQKRSLGERMGRGSPAISLRFGQGQSHGQGNGVPLAQRIGSGSQAVVVGSWKPTSPAAEELGKGP